jgi:hypothetical protein
LNAKLKRYSQVFDKLFRKNSMLHSKLAFSAINGIPQKTIADGTANTCLTGYIALT